MTNDPKDGGPAFPWTHTPVGGRGGMSLRDWFAGHATEPSKEEIEFQSKLDAQRNPHGDYHKPPRRSVAEIVAEHKFKYADAMLAARKEQT